MLSVSAAMSEAHPRLAALVTAEETVGAYYARAAAEPPGTRDVVTLGLIGEAVERLTRTSGLAGLVSRPNAVVSFAEHHASITHPETVTVVAGQSIYAEKTGGTTIFSLSCGTTPLDNELFPRGLMAGWRTIPFLSNKFRRLSPLTCPRIDVGDFSRRLDTVADVLRDAHEAVITWWSGLAEEIDPLTSFWQQLSAINHSLFRRIFPRGDYVMVPMELVARELMLAWLDRGIDAWFLRLLFDSRGRDTLIRTLDGVRSFWEIDRYRGTFLFWHNDSGRLRPVFPDGADLVGAEGARLRVPLRPDAIVEALRGGVLLPAPSCAFLTLVFHAGLRNFGGLLQYDYLAQARRRLVAADDLGLNEQEHMVLATCPDSYYVNFEEKMVLTGGLARIAVPITERDLDAVAAERLGDSMQGCLAWVNSLYR